MKRIIFALLLLPQLAFSQYRADCFRLDLSDDVSHVQIGNTFDRDTTLSINERTIISGLSISGTAVLNNDNDSYIRVTLVDNSNYEFLVYEIYPTLSDNRTTKFSNTAQETILLDDITPQYMKINILNASLVLDTINYSYVSANNRQNSNNPAVIQNAQIQYIVDKLNVNLERRNMTWRAGVTSISEKTYAEKKDMFGGNVPKLYGFEYYVGGIFVVPGEYLNSSLRSASLSSYISEWDWRNRHGKNWMTAVKNQNTLKNCASCWAFSAIGAFEAYINLYYNQLLNYDLSEQEIVSCGNAGNCQDGGSLDLSLYHINTSGAIPETCFPYTATNSSCNYDPPADVLSFEQYPNVYATDEDSIKKSLFNSPICFGIYPWWHYVVLVGYKQIHSGDYYFTANNDHYTVSIQANDPLVGHAAWLIKNCWGSNWGDNGYGYVAMSLSDAYDIYSLSGNVTSQQLNENNIVCEDADGDGYYFWGIGSKPSYCPSWVPNIKDGNDDNYSKGKLLLENTPIIGELETLNPNGNSTLVINGNINYTTRQSKYSHIRITSGGKLTVKNILNLFGRVTVTIESGGELVVDGGVVTNANVSLSSGGKVTLKNGGKLVMRTNTDFIVPTGALADIQHGEIIRSNDY